MTNDGRVFSKKAARRLEYWAVGGPAESLLALRASVGAALADAAGFPNRVLADAAGLLWQARCLPHGGRLKPVGRLRGNSF